MLSVCLCIFVNIIFSQVRLILPGYCPPSSRPSLTTVVIKPITNSSLQSFILFYLPIAAWDYLPKIGSARNAA